MNTNEVIVHKTRTQNELFLHRLYFAATDWDELLGSEVFCTWLKLFKRVDRSADAKAKYGNKNTIPFSLQRLAELLGKSVNTLRKHVRILWNYGLVDFIEWGACKKLGKKPINIVVYPYPCNDQQLATQQLKKVRDYDGEYEQGEFETYIERETVIEMSYDPQESAQPFLMSEAPPETPAIEPVPYDEYVRTFAENTPQSPSRVNVQPADYSNVQPVDYSNVQPADYSNVQPAAHNNIYNALVNNTNAELIKDNALLTKDNAEYIHAPNIINKQEYNNACFSSSSLLDKQNMLDKEDEEKQNELPANMQFICDVLETALSTRNIKRTEIEKIKQLAIEKQLEFVTVEMINEQLDFMATEKAAGKQIFVFSKYFINGIEQKIADYEFYKNNDQNEIFLRKMEERGEKEQADQIRAYQAQKNGAPLKDKIFYNWLDEREDEPAAAPAPNKSALFYNWLDEVEDEAAGQ